MTLNIDFINKYPSINVDIVEKLLNQCIENNKKKIIVLDDDPTGVQTVHDVSVYTDWSEESIREGFLEENKLFYILTNSRGLTVDETIKVHQDIANKIVKISKDLNKEFLIISRSDSTLRGHFPIETQVLKEVIEEDTDIKFNGEIICPFFKEGGRFTIDDIHYVKYGDKLIPASETEFSKDLTFGYKNSNLKKYVEEKTNGRYKEEDVCSISLELLRDMKFKEIENIIISTKGFNKIIVNAIDYSDLMVFCVSFFSAMSKGNNYMLRSAAGIVKILGGIATKPLLKRDEMIIKETKNGGLIIIGSHTEKTTRQLEKLKELEDIEYIMFDTNTIKDEEEFKKSIKKCIMKEEEVIKSGKTICVYTSRNLIRANTGNIEDDLKLSIKISNAVQSLVSELEVEPSFIIAKGGITSSDIGTKALRVKKAKVLGQIRAGIPVWSTGLESKFPQIPYVIFPGNVGEEETLKESVEILK